MRVIIVDDEIYAIRVLSELLKKYEGINVVNTYIDAIDAINNLEHDKPDAVFLDIHLGVYSGIDLANRFFNYDPDIEIVFVTAFSEYALQAFELNAQDYLLKPITQRRLDKTIARIAKNNKGNVNNDYSIRAFGRFELVSSAGESIMWRTRKTKELFAYLWFHRNKETSKNKIMDDIFYEKKFSSSQSLLHTSIYYIRKTLADFNIPSELTYANSTYKLHLEIESDYDQVLKLISKTNLSESDIDIILDTYTSQLFDQQDYIWSDYDRIYFNNLVLKKLKEYTNKYSSDSGRSRSLVLVLTFLLKVDPLDEVSVLKLMNYYADNKMYLQLEHFYNEYADYLMKEYDFIVSEMLEKAYYEIMNTSNV